MKRCLKRVGVTKNASYFVSLIFCISQFLTIAFTVEIVITFVMFLSTFLDPFVQLHSKAQQSIIVCIKLSLKDFPVLQLLG